MTTKIVLELADSLYEQTHRFAEIHQQKIDEVISSFIEEALAAKAAPEEAKKGEADEEILDWTEADPLRDRELQAYEEMHAYLKERYLGKYVAIYQGELVDVDDDPAELEERTSAKYGDSYVLVAQVKPELMQTYVIRSPRIMRD